MKIINNWKQAPRMYSVQALAAIAALQGVQAYLTAEQLAAPILFAPEWTYASALQAATAFLGITGLIARLIAQDLPQQQQQQGPEA
jgi:hypothetical protein